MNLVTYEGFQASTGGLGTLVFVPSGQLGTSLGQSEICAFGNGGITHEEPILDSRWKPVLNQPRPVASEIAVAM